MRKSRSIWIVVLSIVVLSPVTASGANETPSQSSGIIGVANTDQADRSAPSVVTNFKQDQVVRGWVVITGTAHDDVGITTVRIGIRDRATGKWLQADGRFTKTFYRVAATVDAPGKRDVGWRLAVHIPGGSYAASIRAVDIASKKATIRPRLRFRVKPQGALLAAAGDVALCSTDGHRRSAALLDEAFAHRDGVVALLGDGAYNDGTRAEYQNCYDSSWGRHKGRTRPTPGNHDYNTAGAAGYFEYFGARAGDAAKGYYAYDLGAWRIIVLNSECRAAGGCGKGSPQYNWLKWEIAANSKQCVLSYSHRPRFTSGPHGDGADLEPLWDLLYAGGADVALAGHSHNYQRFEKMDPTGNVSAAGIRSFVVGTGGTSLAPIDKAHTGLASTSTGEYGVLFMELSKHKYSWEFITVDGHVRDAGSGGCG